MEDETRTLSSYRRAPHCERSVTRVWSEITQSLRQLQYDELCGEMQGQPDCLAFDQDLPPPRPDMPAATPLSDLCACQRAYSAVLACHATINAKSWPTSSASSRTSCMVPTLNCMMPGIGTTLQQLMHSCKSRVPGQSPPAVRSTSKNLYMTLMKTNASKWFLCWQSWSKLPE